MAFAYGIADGLTIAVAFELADGLAIEPAFLELFEFSWQADGLPLAFQRFKSISFVLLLLSQPTERSTVLLCQSVIEVRKRTQKWSFANGNDRQASSTIHGNATVTTGSSFGWGKPRKQERDERGRKP